MSTVEGFSSRSFTGNSKCILHRPQTNLSASSPLSYIPFRFPIYREEQNREPISHFRRNNRLGLVSNEVGAARLRPPAFVDR
jgi:hypothetical protein